MWDDSSELFSRPNYVAHFLQRRLSITLRFPYFPVPRFPPLWFGAGFSSLAISTPAIWCRVFQFRVFQSRVFSAPLLVCIVCVHDPAATPGQYLDLSKAWRSGLVYMSRLLQVHVCVDARQGQDVRNNAVIILTTNYHKPAPARTFIKPYAVICQRETIHVGH